MSQLIRLSGSALQVPVWVVGWAPTHYQVKLQLQLRLSWAVTTCFAKLVILVQLNINERRTQLFTKDKGAHECEVCQQEGKEDLVPSE